MTVSDIMTDTPITCSVRDPLGQVARAMATHDCGALPVVEATAPHRPRGILTDRDIVLRTVAEDIDPLKMKAADVMTDGAFAVAATDTVDRCLEVMRTRRVRRVVVVDPQGACCGLVTLSDLARHLPPDRVGRVLQHIVAPQAASSPSAA